MEVLRMIVDINKSGNILLFKHMNQAIVDSYKRKGVIPSMGQHKDAFEQTYGVQVIVDNSTWRALEFASEQDYTMAVLKWL